MSRQNFKSSDEKITCLVQLDKRVEGVENFAVFLRVHISIMVKYTRILSVHTAEPDLQILQFFKVEYIYHG